MEFPRAGVEHIVHFRAGRGRGFRKAALARGVVDRDAGLDVVGVDAEAHLVVLHGLPFHQNAACDQLAALKHRRDAVEHVVAGLLDVVGDHVFKGQHTLHVQVARAGDEVALVGIFARELVADEVAAVVEIFTVHTVVFRRLPAGGLDLTDGPALFRGHQVLPDAGVGHAAAPQLVQIAVALEGNGGVVRFGEVGVVPVDGDVSAAGIRRDLGSRGWLRRCSRLRRNQAAAGQQQAGKQQSGKSFHFV